MWSKALGDAAVSDGIFDVRAQDVGRVEKERENEEVFGYIYQHPPTGVIWFLKL